MSNQQDIITYCHIGKVGGKQLQYYLRSYFGLGYRCVDHAIAQLYGPEDLQSELRLNPRIRYLGGHDVRPHVDFGPYESRLKWFSFFREPFNRLLSHYYQQTSKPGAATLPVLEWMDRNPNRAYWQTYMISGTPNAANAIEIIDTKYTFVGLNERYEESLLLFSKIFSLDGFRFQNRSEKKGPEDQKHFMNIIKNVDSDKAEIIERLGEDMALYKYASERYEKQILRYGKEQIDAELAAKTTLNSGMRRANPNNIIALSLDHVLWRNFARLRKIT